MSVEELLKELTIEEKILLLSETAPEIPRLGISSYHHGNEALHGVVRPGKFTVFPQAIAMGASFHKELVEEVAEAISDEARARHNENKGEMVGGDFDGLYNGLLTFWSPNLNTARDPRWGRTGETYGEDPYLAGEMGTAFVKGLQGKDPTCLKTVATPKHFTGNNEEHNRFECNAEIPRDIYFDYYLKPFETVVKEGKCEGIMAAYNAVNGIPCHENRELLTEILRGRWGFEGYVVSDCGAISHLVDRHKTASSPEEAATKALKAGVDLECGSCGTILQVYGNYLKKALEKGMVAEKDLDLAVSRVLRAREKLGILKKKESSYDALDERVIGNEKHQKLALRLAEESMVLLKNREEGGKALLPISPGKTICVIGPQADRCQFGDYSGQPVTPPISILDGLKEEFGENKIFHIPFQKPEDLGSFKILEEVLWHEEKGEKKKGLLGSYRSLSDSSQKIERADKRIDFEWENMAPDPLIQRKQFEINWEGILIPKTTGDYEFLVVANEKETCQCKAFSCLCIDGKPVKGKPVKLSKGQEYRLTLEYINRGERPSIKLSWKGCSIKETDLYREEIEAAKQCDYVVACLGFGTECEAEGRDKTDLGIPKEQTALLEAVYPNNPHLIVTLYNGSSLTIPWILEHAGAVLECWYPGEQGGRAAARILDGKVNPSGRLPLSFYQGTEDLPPFDCYDIRKGFTYLYAPKLGLPFGYGLSYSSYDYTDFRLFQTEGYPGEAITGSVTVKNSGKQNGAEVLQIYISYQGDGAEPARLSWIEKVFLKAGEEKRVFFRIPERVLEAYQEQEDRPVVREGSYRISLSRDSKTPVLTALYVRKREQYG